MVRAGLGLWFSEPLPRIVHLTRQAEEWGYSHIWYPNHKLHRDLYVGTTVLAMASQRLEVGTFIAELYSLHPALVAAAIASIDELTGGRAILALGAGGTNFREIDLERRHPLRVMEDGVAIIRRLFGGETVNFEGDTFRLRDAKLQFPVRPDLPIWIATRGDSMLELAGRIADGVMIATYATPAGVRHAMEMIRRGAETVRRPFQRLRLASRVDTCISSSSKEARQAVKPMIARFLAASYPDKGFVRQAGLEIPPALEKIVAEKKEAQTAASGHLVPDEFVEPFTWAGTVEEVAAKVEAVVELGITDICILPQPLPDGSYESTIRSFIEDVIPRVRRSLG